MSSSKIIGLYKLKDSKPYPKLVDFSIETSNLILQTLTNVKTEKWDFNNLYLKKELINNLIKTLKSQLESSLYIPYYENLKQSYKSMFELDENYETHVINENFDYFDDSMIRNMLIEMMNKLCVDNLVYGDIDFKPYGDDTIYQFFNNNIINNPSKIEGIYLFDVGNICAIPDFDKFNLPLSSIFTITFMNIIELRYARERSLRFKSFKSIEPPTKKRKI